MSKKTQKSVAPAEAEVPAKANVSSESEKITAGEEAASEGENVPESPENVPDAGRVAGNQDTTPAVAEAAEHGTPVIIPYRRANNGTPESLAMVARAWRKFATFPVFLIVVGEVPAEHEVLGDAFFLSYSDAEPSADPQVNIVRAVKHALDTLDISGSFILVSDDTVPLRPFGIADICPRVMREWPVGMSENSDNPWLADMARSVRYLGERKAGSCEAVPPRYFADHGPKVYDATTWFNMVVACDMCNVGYVQEVLYYNGEALYNDAPGKDCPEIDNHFDNGYCFILMPFDSRQSIDQKLRRHLFVSFGATVTAPAAYRQVGEYIGSVMLS